MTTSSLKPHLDKLLLAAIFSVLSTSTIAWTLRDQTPPPWDPSDHLRYAFDYYRLLAHADFSGFAREFFSTHHYYAPFVHLVTALVFLSLGASRLTGIFVNLLSLAGLLWAVAVTSRGLYGHPPGEIRDRPAQTSLAVLPALLAGCYHFSAWLMHDAFLDYPLIAIVAVTVALLVRAGDFRVRRDALAFGIAAGIGLLVKQTFAFFFILPGLYVAIRVLWARDRRAVANLTLALLVMLLIAAIWYGPHMNDVIAIYRENRQAAINENEAPLYTFDSNFFYVHALISMQMQLPLAILFAAGLGYSLIRCPRSSILPCLMLVSGIASFALVANKDVRYTAPVLSAAAILSTGWLREFGPVPADAGSTTGRTRRLVKLALVAVIAAWSFVSFFNAQWPRPGFGKAIDTPRYRWMVFARNYYGFDHRPLDQDWSVPEIVRAVSKMPGSPRTSPGASANGGAGARPASTPVLGVIVNLPYLNPSSLALYSRLMAEGRAGPPLIDVRWVVEPAMLNRIQDCDYILVRTGLEKAEWVSRAEREVERLIRDNPNEFTRETGFPIPLAGAEAVIYRNETPKR